MALHLGLWPLGCAWAGLLRLCGSTGRSRYRAFRPVPPRFPALVSGAYWKRRRFGVKKLCEGVFSLVEAVGTVFEIFG